MTNLNTNPYYDDFDETKNYLKILFKPGYAVQARELTQLQTALQNQISRFGGHVFDDGAIVLNGKTFSTDLDWIDVTIADASIFAGTTIVGATSKAIGKIFSTKKIDANTTRLYFAYFSGNTFARAENITIESITICPVIDNVAFSGKAKAFSIEDSVFFVRGHFVFCNKQSVVFVDTKTPANVKIGLSISESIVSSAKDETLLDPAQGSNNYAAPGADRFTISLNLTVFQFDPQIEATVTGDFIELSRYVNSQLINKVEKTKYSEIEETLARRTYDESGDYTVRAFGLSVIKNVYGDDNKLSLAIEPGKAYIKGFEFETITTTNKDLDKARDFRSKTSRIFQADFGDYLIVSTPSGAVLNYASNPSVNLVNASAVTIGTGNIRSIQYHSAGLYRIYLFNVVVSTPSAIASIRSGSWIATISAAAYSPNPVSFVKSYSKTHLLDLPNSPVKTLLTDTASNTSYVAHRSYSVTFTTTSAIINTGAANVSLLSSSVNDYIVVNSATGATVTVASVTPVSSTSATIVISGATGINATIYTQVSIAQATPKIKSLVTTTTTGLALSASAISLQKADCYKIIKIMARDTAVTPVASIDVTNFYNFDNGQRDDVYDHGTITLKTGASISAVYDVLDVTFSYFSQSSTTGFFSVDSYSGAVAYTDIPKYTSSSGIMYDLRDCIDFRPRRADASTTIIGSDFVQSNSTVVTDYYFYLGRIDKLVLTKERRFDVIKGISDESPKVPDDLFDAMTLYVINVPAYTNKPTDVSFSYIDNKRFTMRDIGKIEKRVERMEYYALLSALEKQAREEVVPSITLGVERFKNGVLVDSFTGHSVGDVGNIDYKCSIDPENRVLRPKFTPYSYNYVTNTLTNAKQLGDLITLPYTSNVLVENAFATNTVNLNPYMVFKWKGSINIEPATDTWVDTFTKPDVVVNLAGENDVFSVLTENPNNPAAIGVRYNDWQTVNRGTIAATAPTSNNRGSSVTTVSTATGTNSTNNSIVTDSVRSVSRDLGSRVVDTSIIPFIRSRVLTFAARNMRPNTDLMGIFDDIDVNSYCNSAQELRISGIIRAGATKVRNVTSTKEATILLISGNRVFVQMDANKFPFTINENVSWLVDGSWYENALVTYVNTNASLKTNEFGEIAGTFFIPNNNRLKFRTGERIFRIASSIGPNPDTYAEVKYIAQGMAQSVEKTIVSTRVVTTTIEPPPPVVINNITNVSNVTNITNNPPPPPAPIGPIRLSCAVGQEVSDGSSGRFIYDIDFGATTGDAGIAFNTGNGPVQMTLIWNGQTYSSGFLGSSTFNSTLASMGFPNVSGASGTNINLKFTKTSATPALGKLIVESPLPGTAWAFRTLCPTVAPVTPDPVPPPFANAAISMVPFSGNLTTTQGSVTPLVISSGFVGWGGNSASKTAVYRLTSITPTVDTDTAGVFNNMSVISSGIGATYTDNGNVSIPFSLVLNPPFTLSGIVGGSLTTVFTYVSGDAATGAAFPTLTATARFSATISIFITRPSPPQIDPVAQTFFIDPAVYPNGVFVSGLDLYFAKKSTKMPVIIQLRSVVNGYPSSAHILPFGTCVKDASDISVSANGTVPTHFDFQNIVHLGSGEYSFVVLAETDEYEIYTSRIGEFSLADSNQRVTSQPILGSMFKSQNGSVWTPIQEEDVKFKLYKCVFDISLTGVAVMDTNIPVTNNGDVQFDMFYTMGEVVDFAATNIDYSYKILGDAAFTPYQLGSNVSMSATKTLLASNKSSVQFKTTLTTTDSNITPVVDLNRLSSVLVRNIINNDATNETLPNGGNALSKYITRKVKLNPDFASTDIKVYFVGNIPTGTSVKVYYKVAISSDPFFDDNVYTEMVLEYASTFTDSQFSEYKYKTVSNMALASSERYDTFAVKLVMLSTDTTKVPLIKDLRILALDD